MLKLCSVQCSKIFNTSKHFCRSESFKIRQSNDEYILKTEIHQIFKNLKTKKRQQNIFGTSCTYKIKACTISYNDEQINSLFSFFHCSFVFFSCFSKLLIENIKLFLFENGDSLGGILNPIQEGLFLQNSSTVIFLCKRLINNSPIAENCKEYAHREKMYIWFSLHPL